MQIICEIQKHTFTDNVNMYARILRTYLWIFTSFKLRNKHNKIQTSIVCVKKVCYPISIVQIFMDNKNLCQGTWQFSSRQRKFEQKIQVESVVIT